MSPTAPLAYRPQLDALRAIAVGLVLLSHFWLTRSGLGHLGVRLFFVLSGFLITSILLRDSGLVGFYARRALRLAPALYLALALALLLDLDGMRSTWKWHVLQLSNLLFAVHDSWSVAWPADHLWSLNVEEQFYLLWPLVIAATPRRWLAAVLAAFAVAAPLFRVGAHLLDWGGVAASVLPPASFDALSVGALLAVAPTRHVYRWGLVAAPLLLLTVFRTALPPGPWLDELAELGALPSLAALVLAGWKGDLPLSHPWLVGLGRMSYGVYLYHGFVFGAAARLGLSQHGPVLFLVCTAVTLVVAWLSHRLVETPIRAFGRRWLEARPPSPGRLAAPEAPQPARD